jgi:cell division protein FtsB
LSTIKVLKKDKNLAMIKKISFILGLLFVLLISYNLISQIISTLKSGERVDQATEILNQLENENKNLKVRLEEVKSKDFIETQARDKLGLAKEGEVVVIIPDEKIDLLLGLEKKQQEARLPNPLGWWKLFF